MSDAVLFGIDPAEVTTALDSEDEGIWAEHLPALEAFLAISTQWRAVSSEGRIIAIGLDYQGVQAGLDLAGLAMTPALWEQVREIEAGAVAALNGKDDSQ